MDQKYFYWTRKYQKKFQQERQNHDTRSKIQLNRNLLILLTSLACVCMMSNLETVSMATGFVFAGVLS